MKLIAQVICILLLFINQGLAFEILSISNGVITLDGGAGTKTTAAPILDEKFEVGTAGNLIASNVWGANTCEDCWSDYNALTNSTGSSSPIFSTDNSRGVSTLNAKFPFSIRNGTATSDFSDSLLNWAGSEDLTGNIFVSYWMYYEEDGVTTDTLWQHKMFRLIADGESGFDSNGPNIYFLRYTTFAIAIVHPPDDFSVVSPTDLKAPLSTEPFIDPGWNYFQIEIIGGSSGDGYIKWSVLNGTKSTTREWTGTTLKSGAFRDFMFGHIMANVETPDTLRSDIYIDDIYVDKYFSRVVVGNALNYLDCTVFEVQPPTEWDGTGDRIVITENPGGLTSGYMFVVNDSRVISDQDTGTAGNQGFPYTFTPSTAPVVVLQADKQATSPTTYAGSFTVETGRTASTVVSSNGFTVTCDDGDCTDEETEAFTVSGVTVPITDVITVTDSSAETGNDSITITLPTPTTTSASIKDATVKRAILK